MQKELFGPEEYGGQSLLYPWRRVFGNIARDKRYPRDIHTISVMLIELEERLGIVAKRVEQAWDGGNFHFVTVSVSAEDMPKIEELYGSPEAVFDFLQETVGEGLKVSFALNDKNGMVVCSLFDRRKDSPSTGACLTGGAATWYDALRVVAYKYTALLHGDLCADGNVLGLTGQIW